MENLKEKSCKEKIYSILYKSFARDADKESENALRLVNRKLAKNNDFVKKLVTGEYDETVKELLKYIEKVFNEKTKNKVRGMISAIITMNDPMNKEKWKNAKGDSYAFFAGSYDKTPNGLVLNKIQGKATSIEGSAFKEAKLGDHSFENAVIREGDSFKNAKVHGEEVFEGVEVEGKNRLNTLKFFEKDELGESEVKDNEIKKKIKVAKKNYKKHF